MTCEEARPQLLDLRRGRLDPAVEREVAVHLQGCAACAAASAEEDLLSSLLERLPSRQASPALRRRLATLAAAAARLPSEAPAAGLPEAAATAMPVRFTRSMAAAVAVGALAVAAVALIGRTGSREAGPLAALTSEAVSDHLRVLQRERPVDVESGGTHDVKPWFEGKLDFAPAVPAPVAPEMRLVGGTVGYFLDRPAAVVVYGVRKHVVTLLAFRADGLAWPADGGEATPRAPSQGALRGFHVFLWRSGGLGYALVGDVDPAELSEIAAKMAGAT
jgi:anti-sigma factor RsiW